MRKYFALFLILTMLLSGCAAPDGSPSDTTLAPNETNDSETTGMTEDYKNKANVFSDSDIDASYDDGGAVRISLNGTSATSSSKAVHISGTTITLTSEAEYIVSGTLDDGMVVVDAKKEDEIRIVLDDADITNKDGAAIYVVKAGKVTVTLADKSENSLSGGELFAVIDDNNINAVIYSKCDLVLNGTGKLTVNSPAGHGISAKDTLVITGGTYEVASASHAIDANDSIAIGGAAFTLDAGKDGIHAENSDDMLLGSVYISDGSFKIEAEGDGISASSTLQIDDGEFDIVAGGGAVNGNKASSDFYGGFGGNGMRPSGGAKPPSGTKPSQGTKPQTRPIGMTETVTTESESIKGIKASSGMVVSGGNFKIDSADDAIHSNGNLTINGGVFDIKTGDDGFHADDTLSINAGTVNISESYEALEGLHIIVSGGKLNVVAKDDGINAAGGNDDSGYGGVRGDTFGGFGGFGGMGGSSNGSVGISGGELYIKASGDAIDANGTLEITGGHTTVCGPTSGDTSILDYDKTATIKNGTFIGTGSTMMAQSISGAGQGVIAVNASSKSVGVEITLLDKNGNTVLSFTPELTFARVVISTPDIVSGESYTLKTGTQSTSVKAK